jgi:hypothetical protein
MKLSDAIRLGSMLVPQGFDHPVSRSGQGTACALEAACLAMSIDDWSSTVTTFPIANAPAMRVCPACGYVDTLTPPDDPTLFAVWHLNDFHRWTRERIADWVETIEAQYEPKPITEYAQKAER